MNLLSHENTYQEPVMDVDVSYQLETRVEGPACFGEVQNRHPSPPHQIPGDGHLLSSC